MADDSWCIKALDRHRNWNLDISVEAGSLKSRCQHWSLSHEEFPPGSKLVPSNYILTLWKGKKALDIHQKIGEWRNTYCLGKLNIITNDTGVSADYHNTSMFCNWRYSWLEINGSFSCNCSSVQLLSISWLHYTLWALSLLGVASSVCLSAEERELDKHSSLTHLCWYTSLPHLFHT